MVCPESPPRAIRTQACMFLLVHALNPLRTVKSIFRGELSFTGVVNFHETPR